MTSDCVTSWKAYNRPDEGYYVLDPSGVTVAEGMNWHQVLGQVKQQMKSSELLLYYRWEDGEYVACSPFSRV